MIEQQISLYNVEIPPTKKKDNLRRKWENGFQRWSNKEQENEASNNGKCGYGSFCEFCENVSWGRPCVRALNKMCRHQRLIINYAETSYENAWNGIFRDADKLK